MKKKITLIGDNMDALRKLDTMLYERTPIHSYENIFNVCSMNAATMPQSPHSPAMFWGALRINRFDSPEPVVFPLVLTAGKVPEIADLSVTYFSIQHLEKSNNTGGFFL